MSLVKFLKGTEANITKLKSTFSVTEGALYVATDTGTMWLGTSKTSLLQIKDNVDTNTTYTLSKSGSTITLNGTDGSSTSVTDDVGSYTNATTTVAGLMSAADKVKLNGIATGATKVDVDDTLSSTSTNPVQNKVINSALDGKANSSHTHLYAGSATAGGSANSAVKLDSNAGSENVPVYFSGGKPVACTAYSQAKVKEAAEEYTVVQDTEDGMLYGGLIPDPGDNRIRIWLCVGDSGQLESVKVYVTE